MFIEYSVSHQVTYFFFKILFIVKKRPLVVDDDESSASDSSYDPCRKRSSMYYKTLSFL